MPTKTKIDLNRADEVELRNIEGISRERARVLMEHRTGQGPFRSWDDVKAVPGFSDALVEKLREHADLKETEDSALAGDGGRGGAAPEAGAIPLEEAEAEEEFEEEEDEDEIRTLVALAQMDAEAAAAYEAAAELVFDDELKEALRAFGSDHARHVTDIGRCLDKLGESTEFATPPPEESVFALLTSAVSALGPRAAVLSLVGNERFTNATYETALEFVSNPEARALLEKNFEDEQRHLAWLLQYAERTAHGEELHEGTSPSA
ncbi:MAG TPA: helix-hairpin-helix domain-containing protein [Polyangiaceae bacterium]|nr:helix-hairpin-helix domain-containing protein [Polyangiaceae bacterium]